MHFNAVLALCKPWALNISLFHFQTLQKMTKLQFSVCVYFALLQLHFYRYMSGFVGCGSDWLRREK